MKDGLVKIIREFKRKRKIKRANRTKKGNIEGIRTVVVNDHHKVLPFWSDFENATLLHIDAHADAAEGPRISRMGGRDIDCGNFLIFAVYKGYVSSVYWLNPHSISKRLLDFGTFDVSVGRYNMLSWNGKDKDLRGREIVGRSKDISIQQMRFSASSPFILDIDLDAFCCHTHIHNNEYPIDNGVQLYQRRIEETVISLEQLPEPDLITIARSQGRGFDDDYDCYVPPRLVDEVQSQLLSGLSSLYSQRA